MFIEPTIIKYCFNSILEQSAVIKIVINDTWNNSDFGHRSIFAYSAKILYIQHLLLCEKYGYLNMKVTMTTTPRDVERT